MKHVLHNRLQIVVLSILLAAPAGAVAEDAGRGRLADGRAYRTTRDGIELVDQVAELEVSIEEMKRQVEAAQNEISLKDLQIEKLERAAHSAAPVRPVALQCPPQPQLICPEISEEEIQSVKAEAGQLKKELEKVRQESDVQRNTLSRESSKSAELVQARDQEISLLRAKLKIADEQVTFLKSLKGVSRNESVRASVSLPQTALAQPSSALSQQPRAADEQKIRQQTLESYRKGVRSEINQVRELMQQRDALFTQYASSRKSVQIKPSTAHSSQNRGIEQLQKDLETESSMRMIALMGREVHEIREKVADDIELVKRIGKL